MMCSVACLLRFSFGSSSRNSDSGLFFTPTTGSWAKRVKLEVSAISARKHLECFHEVSPLLKL